MALNPQLFPNGLPVPFIDELFVLSRDGVEFEVDKIPGANGGHVKARGTIYLSNIRMVFVANKPVGNFIAFDVPLVFSTMLELKGIPKTDEDHIYLFRFPAYRPLVFQLKDGYKIQVTEQDPPIEGLEVKRRGIYLIFEGDDDYEGNEESLDENQLSISEKLAKFFCSLEQDDHISESGHEVISQAQEIEEQDETENGSFCRVCGSLFEDCPVLKGGS